MTAVEASRGTILYNIVSPLVDLIHLDDETCVAKLGGDVFEGTLGCCVLHGERSKAVEKCKELLAYMYTIALEFLDEHPGAMSSSYMWEYSSTVSPTHPASNPSTSSLPLPIPNPASGQSSVSPSPLARDIQRHDSLSSHLPSTSESVSKLTAVPTLPSYSISHVQSQHARSSSTGPISPSTLTTLPSRSVLSLSTSPRTTSVEAAPSWQTRMLTGSSKPSRGATRVLAKTTTADGERAGTGSSRDLDATQDRRPGGDAEGSKSRVFMKKHRPSASNTESVPHGDVLSKTISIKNEGKGSPSEGTKKPVIPRTEAPVSISSSIRKPIPNCPKKRPLSPSEARSKYVSRLAARQSLSRTIPFTPTPHSTLPFKPSLLPWYLERLLNGSTEPPAHLASIMEIKVGSVSSLHKSSGQKRKRDEGE